MKRFQANLAKLGADATNHLEKPLVVMLVVLVASVGYSLLGAFKNL